MMDTPYLSLFLLLLLLRSVSGSVTQNDVNGPVFNPVTTPAGTATPVPAVVTVPSANIPLTAPGNALWCVAKSGVAEAALQSALDYACGIGGADCSSIQPGAACFYPDDLQTHASVAFNSYYQRNPALTSCDFSGTAVVTTVNPSFGSCVFLASTASPMVPTPIPIPIPVNNPVPTPAAQTYSPPAVFNAGNPPPFLDPGLAGNGGSPPAANSLPVSSASRKFDVPFVGFILFLLPWF